MHMAACTPASGFFVGISVLRQVSQSAAAIAFPVEAIDLVKDFDGTRAVDGVSLKVPAGSIYGLLGPNGAGKTTTLRILIGIIDPSSGTRRLLGRERPLEAASEIGYLPEERGLYPAMHARDAIAFMGALRGMPLNEGRRRAEALLDEHNLGDWAKKPIRALSKGMAQTVQLLGTIIHKPRLIILDEPFAGLDAINQARLEELIRREARAGVTIIFSTHVIAHAERLCERVAIIARGKVAFDGRVDEARARLRPIVRLRTRASDGPWRSAIPSGARREGDEWVFDLPESGPEPLLKALIDGGAGIETLAIERPGLHDAFVAIAGSTAAQEMGKEKAR
jgi:ABC-2 type transport system ATP-binding protein